MCVCYILNVLRWTLTALVECVEPSDVISAHLPSVTKADVGVRDRDHGGLVVLGEGVPTAVHTAVRLNHSTTHTYDDTVQGWSGHVCVFAGYSW